MPRPSSARPRNSQTRPRTKPVLLTLDRCGQCYSPLPHDETRPDNHLLAVGMTCPICDRPLCPTCSTARVGDEESVLLAHYRLDEGYATQRAASLILPDDAMLATEIIEQIVEDRVASIMTATQPIVRMTTLVSLSRARKSVSPLAYAFDQIVLARLQVLRLRGEFKPSGYRILPTRIPPAYAVIMPSDRDLRGSSVPAPRQLPNPPYMMADGENDPLAPPATMGARSQKHVIKTADGRKITVYTETTDPGRLNPGDR